MVSSTCLLYKPFVLLRSYLTCPLCTWKGQLWSSVHNTYHAKCCSCYPLPSLLLIHFKWVPLCPIGVFDLVYRAILTYSRNHLGFTMLLCVFNLPHGQCHATLTIDCGLGFRQRFVMSTHGGWECIEAPCDPVILSDYVDESIQSWIEGGTLSHVLTCIGWTCHDMNVVFGNKNMSTYHGL